MKQTLLIDDEPKNIFALNAVLKAEGFSCKTASSAEEGLSILSLNPTEIDIILIDMMMPDMDGYEAIAEIRKNDTYSSIPIVAVTAQTMVGDKKKCLNAGATAYISKPINVDSLIEILKEYHRS